MKRGVLYALACIVFVAVFAIFAPPRARAQTAPITAPAEAVPSKDTYDQTIIQDTKDGNVSLDSWSLRSLGSNFAALSSFSLGISDPRTGQSVVRGIVPEAGNMIALLIKNRPASAEVWLADLLHNSRLIPQAYAQGIGFRSLNPVLPIWKTTRDLSYVFFVLVFVVIGFAIMFRQKLSGQAVVTISSALPNLVVTLLLITFSYAIAGFVIDLMYLTIYFIAGIFSTLIDEKTLGVKLVDVAFSQSIFQNGLNLLFMKNGNFDLGGSTVGNAAESIGGIVAALFSQTPDLIKNTLGVGASLVGYVILSMAMLFAVVKTFFSLLKSYVGFVISVILAPFNLLIGSFKGTSEFVQWFRNLVGTLAPFPVVIGMIFIAMALGGQGNSQVGFRDGQLGGFQAPLISVGEGFSGAVTGLIALGVLMLMPEAIDIARKVVGAKDPFAEYLGKIGTNLATGWKGGELIPGIGATKAPGAEALLFGTEKSKKWETGIGQIIGGGAMQVPIRAGGQAVEYGKKVLARRTQDSQKAPVRIPTPLPAPPAPPTAAGAPQPPEQSTASSGGVDNRGVPTL